MLRVIGFVLVLTGVKQVANAWATLTFAKRTLAPHPWADSREALDRACQHLRTARLEDSLQPPAEVTS